MKIEKCETCIHFGTMPVTGDPRPYPCCNVNHKKLHGMLIKMNVNTKQMMFYKNYIIKILWR